MHMQMIPVVARGDRGLSPKARQIVEEARSSSPGSRHMERNAQVACTPFRSGLDGVPPADICRSPPVATSSPRVDSGAPRGQALVLFGEDSTSPSRAMRLSRRLLASVGRLRESVKRSLSSQSREDREVLVRVPSSLSAGSAEQQVGRTETGEPAQQNAPDAAVPQQQSSPQPAPVSKKPPRRLPTERLQIWSGQNKLGRVSPTHPVPGHAVRRESVEAAPDGESARQLVPASGLGRPPSHIPPPPPGLRTPLDALATADVGGTHPYAKPKLWVPSYEEFDPTPLAAKKQPRGNVGAGRRPLQSVTNQQLPTSSAELLSPVPAVLRFRSDDRSAEDAPMQRLRSPGVGMMR
jgi:hypothetical protein